MLLRDSCFKRTALVEWPAPKRDLLVILIYGL